MGLRGTLADLSIVDLVQFPHTGRKSGEMIVVGPEEAAKLFYREGKLVHAEAGELKGVEVLIRIVDWKEGEFEFRQGVETETVSIETDLHRTLMQALKTRDERKLEEKRRKAEEERKRREAEAAGNDGGGLDPALCTALKEFLSSSNFAPYACVMTMDGGVKAEAAGSNGLPEKVVELRTCLRSLIEGYPRQNLKRIFVEDELGTIVLSTLEDGRILVVVAQKATPLGAVAVGVGKLAGALGQAGAS